MGDIMDTSRITKRKLRPFDAANHDDFSIYNHLPYYRDINLCTQEMITLVTGNVIKYFQYKIEETYPLTGMDALSMIKIQEYEKQEKERLDSYLDNHVEPAIEEITANEDEINEPKEKTPEKKRPEYLDLEF